MTKISDVRAVDGVDNIYKFRAYRVEWTARLFPAEDACEVWVSCDLLPSLGYRAIEVPLGSIRDEDDMRDVLLRSDFERGFKNLGMEFDLEDWIRSGQPEADAEENGEASDGAEEEPFAEAGPRGRSTAGFVDQLVSDLTRDLGNEFHVQAEVIDDEEEPEGTAQDNTPIDVQFSFSSDGSDGREPGFHIYFQGQRII